MHGKAANVAVVVCISLLGGMGLKYHLKYRNIAIDVFCCGQSFENMIPQQSEWKA